MIDLSASNFVHVITSLHACCMQARHRACNLSSPECTILVIGKGKIVKSVGIELPDGKIIKPLQEGESYKYLGILEADRFLGEEMKLKVSKGYFRRLQKVLSQN